MRQQSYGGSVAAHCVTRRGPRRATLGPGGPREAQCRCPGGTFPRQPARGSGGEPLGAPWLKGGTLSRGRARCQLAGRSWARARGRRGTLGMWGGRGFVIRVCGHPDQLTGGAAAAGGPGGVYHPNQLTMGVAAGGSQAGGPGGRGTPPRPVGGMGSGRLNECWRGHTRVRYSSTDQLTIGVAVV